MLESSSLQKSGCHTRQEVSMKRRELIRAGVLTGAAAAVVVHPPSAMGQSTAQSSEEERQRNKRAKIVAERHFIDQTSVIPQTPIFTPSADDLLRASVYLETGNNDPSTGIRISLTWTDD
jgi:hypothetical protein